MSFFIGEEKSIIKGYCDKCNDSFTLTYGNRSKRTSCRYHNFVDGYCYDCGQYKNNVKGNCFHITSPNICLTCTIS